MLLFGLRLDHILLLSRFMMSIKPPLHFVINTVKDSIRGRGHTSMVVIIILEKWGINTTLRCPVCFKTLLTLTLKLTWLTLRVLILEKLSSFGG